MNKSLVLNEEVAALESQSQVSRSDITNFLEKLPDEKRIESQISLAKLVGRVTAAIDHLEVILDNDITKNVDSNPNEIRFAAFRGLVTYHRRNKNITILETLHNEFEHLFSDRVMYDEKYAILLRVRGQPDDIYRAIDLLEKVLEDVTNNPGIYQAHANTITQAIEDGIISEEDREQYLSKARQSIDRAISLWRGYGKYHVTKGRILTLQGQYAEARRKVEQGIDLEDPGKEDYAIRIGQFQQHLLRTDFREYETRLQKRLNSAESKLVDIEKESEQVVDRLRNTMLQFLGFFTAVIAAIITTTQIATNYSPSAAGHLILMIFGGLTASFGGLSIIIPKDSARKRGLLITALGLIMSIGALIPLYL